MAKTRVTIVGLGAIGASIGLGLQKAQAEVELMGHDSEPLVARQALKAGAVHKTHWNLISACDGADLVILAVPLLAVEQTLKAIGQELRADCVVMDTTTVKGPVLAWAQELLPDAVHFVGTNPVVATDGIGTDAASADLFRDAVWSICAPPGTPSEAMQLVTDIVSALGGEPYFIDPVEHDGLLAATDHLPLVLAATLLRVVSESGTLEQMSKVGGPQLTRMTSPVMADVRTSRDICLLNRENIVRWLASTETALASVRHIIESGGQDEINALFVRAQRDWDKWLKGEAPDVALSREDLAPSWRTMLFGRIRGLDSPNRK